MNCSPTILAARNCSMAAKVRANDRDLGAIALIIQFAFRQAVEMSWIQKCVRTAEQFVRWTISIWTVATAKAIPVEYARICSCRLSILPFIEQCSAPYDETNESEMQFHRVHLSFRMMMSESSWIKYGMAIPCSVKIMISEYWGNTIWHSNVNIGWELNILGCRLPRWNRALDWSPWNCVCLTEDETFAHYRMKKPLEGTYGAELINMVHCNQELARKMFRRLLNIDAEFVESGEWQEVGLHPSNSVLN